MKSYRGQSFFSVKTEDRVRQEKENNDKYKDKEGAFGLSVYCVRKGIKNQVRIEAMKAYAPAVGVTQATLEDWDTIFENF